MAVRYVREEEALADVIRSGRRAQRNANRPTGTERARTMETAELAATDSEFAKDLAEELGLRTDELTDDVAAVAAVAADAQTTADAAQVEAETARSEATSKAAAAQAAAEQYALAEADAARLAAIAEASGDASDKAAAAEAAAVLAAAQDATAKADAAEAAAKADAAAAQSTANDAATAAAAAQTAAGSAADLAQQAQDSASGKNTIHRDTAAPSGVGSRNGDKWERYDTLNAGGKLVGTWSWWEGQWRSTTIAEAYLPLVDIGSGTYGTLAGARLAATAIDGMTITGAHIRTAPAGQRIELDEDGLRTYGANGIETFRLIASEGGLVSPSDIGGITLGSGNETAGFTTNGIGIGHTNTTDPTQNRHAGYGPNGVYIINDPGSPDSVINTEYTAYQFLGTENAPRDGITEGGFYGETHKPQVTVMGKWGPINYATAGMYVESVPYVSDGVERIVGHVKADVVRAEEIHGFAGSLVIAPNAGNGSGTIRMKAGTEIRLDAPVVTFNGKRQGLIAEGNITAQTQFDITGLTGADRYEITLILPGGSAATDMTARLLTGGTQNASAQYDRMTLVGANSTAAAGNVMSETSWLGLAGGQREQKTIRMTLMNLNRVEPTFADVVTNSWNATAFPQIATIGLRHRTSAAFNGIRFIVPAGTGNVTGRYEVRAL